MPSGSKYWQLRFRWQGKEQVLSFGVYPNVTVSKARQLAAEAKAKIYDNQNPKSTSNPSSKFSEFADRWMLSTDWVEAHRARQESRMRKLIYPSLGHREIGSIEPTDILNLINIIQNAGKIETAKRVKVLISQVFRFAISQQATKYDPTTTLYNAMKQSRVRHMPAIVDPNSLGNY